MLLRRNHTPERRGWRCWRLIQFLILMGLLLIGNACMGWPGLTALLVDRSGEGEHDLPLVLALLFIGGGGSCRYTGQCWIFATGAWTPNPGGLASADSSCQSTAGGLALPGTYRAILLTEDGSRDITHNWVMYSGMSYRTASNGNFTVGTTNAQGVFPFPLVAAIGTVQTWTGADSFWGSNPGLTCTNWTSTVGTGTTGLSSAFSSNMIYSGGTNGCSGALALYCVQQ